MRPSQFGSGVRIMRGEAETRDSVSGVLPHDVQMKWVALDESRAGVDFRDDLCKNVSIF